MDAELIDGRSSAGVCANMNPASVLSLGAPVLGTPFTNGVCSGNCGGVAAPYPSFQERWRRRYEAGHSIRRSIGVSSRSGIATTTLCKLRLSGGWCGSTAEGLLYLLEVDEQRLRNRAQLWRTSGTES